MHQRQVRYRMWRTTVLTEDQYNNLIDGWNKKRHAYRVRAANKCRQEGHDYRETPIGTPEEPVNICVRCLKYVTRTG